MNTGCNLLRTLRITRLASCFLFSILLAFPNAGSSQELEEVSGDEEFQKVTLMFGMEIKKSVLGIEVADLKSDRPVSKKLQQGDILRYYELVREPGKRIPIQRGEDIDAIKELLSQGESLLLGILRPSTPASRGSFAAILVTLEATDLIKTASVVRTELREVVPYASRAPSRNDVEKKEVLVSVFYATDRRLLDGKYTGDPDESAHPIKFGVCTLSIPPTHQPGDTDRPTFWRLEFREDPAKHIVIRSVAEIGEAQTFEAINSNFEELGWNERKRVLVFVHGFNVDFGEAAVRTAQLHYDLNFPGVSMFYSWPSEGSELGYVADSDDVKWSTRNMRSFFETLGSKGFDDVYVVAHSMGNRGVTEALIDVRSSGREIKVKELILASPDINARIFKRDIAPAISQLIPNITLYASSSDLALTGSRHLANGPRAGEIINGRPTVEGFENLAVIDTSTIKTDFIGHSDFTKNDSVISDIRYLIENGGKLPRPNLKEISINAAGGRYWEFIP